MSKTVIIDDSERDHRLVNHINEILRHCRIGRVERKALAPLMPFTPAWDFQPFAFPQSGGYVPVTSSGDVPHLHPTWTIL